MSESTNMWKTLIVVLLCSKCEAGSVMCRVGKTVPVS